MDTCKELLKAYREICNIKKQIGLTAKQDIVKLLTECIAHKYYGGTLIGGSEKARDISNSPTHGNISVKGRPFTHFTRQNTPTGTTPLRTRHWQFDYMVTILIEPEFNEPYAILEYTHNQVKELMRPKDTHDNRWELPLTIENYKLGKEILL